MDRLTDLQDLVSRLRGRDPDEERRVAAKATQASKDYGMDAPEEAGIEPDEVTEGLVDTLATGGGTNLLKSTGRWAAQKAGKEGVKSTLKTLKDRGLPGGASEEMYRRRWNALSGSDRDVHNNDFGTFLENEVSNDKVLQAKANNSAAARRTDVQSNPTEGPALQYEGYQAKERRQLSDASKNFTTPQKRPDLSSGTIEPNEFSPEKAPVVREAQFREHIGPTAQSDALERNKVLDTARRKKAVELEQSRFVPSDEED